MNRTHDDALGGGRAVPLMSTEVTADHMLFDVDQLAEYLSVPASWIYDNHLKLDLPSMKIGRRLRFRLSDVDAWLENRKRSA